MKGLICCGKGFEFYSTGYRQSLKAFRQEVKNQIYIQKNHQGSSRNDGLERKTGDKNKTCQNTIAIFQVKERKARAKDMTMRMLRNRQLGS